MKPTINQLWHLVWLSITFRSYKLTTFIYYYNECGMIATIAYKKSILITKQEFIKTIKAKLNWEYGSCVNKKARRHKINGNVQFILWKTGECGHKEDYWQDFDKSWWHEFKLNNN